MYKNIEKISFKSFYYQHNDKCTKLKNINNKIYKILKVG